MWTAARADRTFGGPRFLVTNSKCCLLLAQRLTGSTAEMPGSALGAFMASYLR